MAARTARASTARSERARGVCAAQKGTPGAGPPSSVLVAQAAARLLEVAVSGLETGETERPPQVDHFGAVVKHGIDAEAVEDMVAVHV